MKLRPKEEELDCTDKLIECTTDCPPNDKECETECVEDYKDCDIPRPEEEIADAFSSVDKGELIAEILCIAAELGGTVERVDTSNSVGRKSKKIVIEYDIEE